MPSFAGLPFTAWLMIAVAGGLGLVIELVFYLRHRGRGGSGETRS